MDAFISLIVNIAMGFFNLLISPWYVMRWLGLDTLKAKDECPNALWHVA